MPVDFTMSLQADRGMWIPLLQSDHDSVNRKSKSSSLKLSPGPKMSFVPHPMVSTDECMHHHRTSPVSRTWHIKRRPSSPGVRALSRTFTPNLNLTCTPRIVFNSKKATTVNRNKQGTFGGCSLQLGYLILIQIPKH